MNKDFEEIGHCGGQYIVEVKTNEQGQRGYSIGMQGSRPKKIKMQFQVLFLYARSTKRHLEPMLVTSFVYMG
ncbi:hypothetical protein [Halobacteriovorax sp. RT-2-6]|uniref:hypothetical protein n=1 Tax=unclassified Halobacteriovorax TaxID=2639665 RepID=UPI00399A09C0